jgi:glutamate dehydrogenase
LYRCSKSLTASFVSEASFIYVLPRTALSPWLQRGEMAAPEVAYAYSVWKFAFSFLSEKSDEFLSLSASLANHPDRVATLNRLRNKMRRERFTEGRVFEAITNHIALVKLLYADFSAKFGGAARVAAEELLKTVKKSVNSEFEEQVGREGGVLILQVFTMFAAFNAHVLKTNFFFQDKVALSFKIDPSFLPVRDYPARPFGMFFVVGAEFRGFHVRFSDIARLVVDFRF